MSSGLTVRVRPGIVHLCQQETGNVAVRHRFVSHNGCHLMELLKTSVIREEGMEERRTGREDEEKNKPSFNLKGKDHPPQLAQQTVLPLLLQGEGTPPL